MPADFRICVASFKVRHPPSVSGGGKYSWARTNGAADSKNKSKTRSLTVAAPQRIVTEFVILVTEPQAELDIPRLVRLRIAELAEGSAGQTRGQASQQMPIGKVKGRGAEFQGLSLPAEMESFGNRQVFIQLRRLPKLCDGAGQVTVDHIRRLHESFAVQIGT